MPEIDQGLKLFGKVTGNLKIEFTPHLIPTFRGILTTIYADLNKKMNGGVSIIRVVKQEKGDQKMVDLLLSLGVSEEGCEDKCL